MWSWAGTCKENTQHRTEKHGLRYLTEDHDEFICLLFYRTHQARAADILEPRHKTRVLTIKSHI